MEAELRKYMAAIGQRGGRASRRVLSPEQARSMVKLREARRAYRQFYAHCFWSYDPDLKIAAADVPWVAEQLMKHGGRKAWEIGAKLCR
jgi:hypothetical protein